MNMKCVESVLRVCSKWVKNESVVCGECVGSAPEVLVEAVLEAVGGAELCLGTSKTPC